MPRLQTTVEATTTTEVELKPSVRRKLLAELRAYASLKEQRDALSEQMDTKKVAIGAIREATGEQSIALEGFKVTEVRGVSSKLDKKKLLLQGVTMAQIEAATTTSPKKPYELVTVPGEKEHE